MITNSIFKGKRLMTYSLIFALAGITTLFTSCLKNDSETNINQPDVAALSVVNASPNSRSINFLLDDKKVNVSGISYLQGFPYITALTGSRKAKVTDNASSNVLATKTISLVKNTYNTLFITGTGIGADSVTLIMAKDSLVRPAAGKVRVRFANLSPGSVALDLAVDGQPAMFTSKAYKTVSDFIEINALAGAKLVIKKQGGAVLASLQNVKLVDGNSYTIYAKGYAAATNNDQKVGIQLINITGL
jgi:hypothetical protein